MSDIRPEDLERPELPPGWSWSELQELVATEQNAMTDGPFGSKLKTAHYVEAGVRVIRLGNLGVGEFKDQDQSFITTQHYESLKKHEVFPGDLLIAALAEPVGRCCEVPEELGTAIVKADCVRFKPHPRLEARFVLHWLNSPRGKKNAETLSHGIGRLRMNMGNMRALPVPLPPSAEQKRIVAKIEALQEEADAAKEALDAIPPLLEKFRQSVLASAFRGDLTKAWREQHPDVEPASKLLERIRDERRRRWEEANPRKKYKEPVPVEADALPELPEGWCWSSVEELCWDGPTNGYSGKSTDTAKGTLTMRLSATTQGRLIVDPSTTKRLTEKVESDSKFWLESGDLLVQRANSLNYLGAAAIFEPADEPMIYPDLMMRLRATSPGVTALLWRYFNSPQCRAWFRSKATGTAGNMPKINGTVLKATLVPLPPEEEAAHVLSVIEQSFDIADDVGGHAAALEQQHGKLNQSILDKAFRGELVPQDPNDEPAEVLLERIRAEREGNGASSSGRRGAKRGRGRVESEVAGA